MMEGKVALVTGSSGSDGIGFGIARSLASRGCSVVLTGSREAEKAEALRLELIKEHDVPVHYFSANLTDVQAIETLYENIKGVFPGGVDILINNAGLMHNIQPIESVSIESWSRILQINLTAPFKLTQLVLPDIKKKGWGRIVNISSVAGNGGIPLVAGSVASKHGLNGLTKTVALETAGSGITCNAVCPGAVNTSMFKNACEALAKEKSVPYEVIEKEFVSKGQPSGQFVETEQIGELVAFLCSSAADQMTGAIIPVDGGSQAK